MATEKSDCAPQLPHRSSASTRPDSDLMGKTAIVTGSNTGIGLECARQLLDRGLSKLILAVRDESKGETAKQALLASGRELEPNAIEIWYLDYSSYDSITSFAARARGLENLDIVVLNAGVYRLSRVILLSTGHEEDIQVNYLSTALLAILLLPVLEAKKRSGTQPGRLTVVSSSIAAWSRFKAEDNRPLLTTLDGGGSGGEGEAVGETVGAKPFDHHQQYCTSKLLAQLFIAELTRRIPPSAVIIDCVNPGLCYGSGLSRDGAGTWLGFFTGVLFRIFGRSCASGAQALVDAATQHGGEVHGQYLDNGKVAKFAPVVYTVDGRQMGQRLWKETMSELSFAGVEGVIRDLTS
ncbi:retinol dehydrogenase 12 [Xylariaceae sp. FL1651]|nr:retinol dehydrogenase 12 [Xylariaceae sp. FL1651]